MGPFSSLDGIQDAAAARGWSPFFRMYAGAEFISEELRTAAGAASRVTAPHPAGETDLERLHRALQREHSEDVHVCTQDAPTDRAASTYSVN